MAWAWESITTALAGKPGEMLARINTRMKALEQFLGTLTFASVDAKVYTTDATVTTLKTVTVPVSTTVLMWGYVVARRTGGSAGAAEDGAAYRVEFTAKNTAGTAALIAAATVTVIGESQAAWDVTVAASGGTVLIKVTGAANNNISWVWYGASASVAA